MTLCRSVANLRRRFICASPLLVTHRCFHRDQMKCVDNLVKIVRSRQHAFHTNTYSKWGSLRKNSVLFGFLVAKPHPPVDSVAAFHVWPTLSCDDLLAVKDYFLKFYSDFFYIRILDCLSQKDLHHWTISESKATVFLWKAHIVENLSGPCSVVTIMLSLNKTNVFELQTIIREKVFIVEFAGLQPNTQRIFDEVKLWFASSVLSRPKKFFIQQIPRLFTPQTTQSEAYILTNDNSICPPLEDYFVIQQFWMWMRPIVLPTTRKTLLESCRNESSPAIQRTKYEAKDQTGRTSHWRSFG